MTCSDATLALGDCPTPDAVLPIDPFSALQVHFGMLLGVDDIQTITANPRGKLRLHNGWLHREGVVWGYKLTLDEQRGELQVQPGLALDALGRELHLDAPACVDLAAWFKRHESDPGFEIQRTEAGVSFDAHVVLRFRACLTRPVPALSDTCENASSSVAFSRASETVEILLLPNRAPTKPVPYHRLRLLFGLEDPSCENAEDLAIVERREKIRQHHAFKDQPQLYLEAFREYAALDTMELEPASDEYKVGGLFPEVEPSSLVLGDVLGITLTRANHDRWKLSSCPQLVTKIRKSHVATATIQELLCGPLLGPDPIIPPDACGPRFDPDKVELHGKCLLLHSTKPLAASTVDRDAFTVTTFDDCDGWSEMDIREVKLEADGSVVRVELRETPAGELLRIIARGTGSEPILGVGPHHVPLAGAVGGPPGSAINGNDFTFMRKRSCL